MTTDPASAGGTGDPPSGGVTEPNPGTAAPAAPPSGSPDPPAATNEALTQAQAEAATWRGRARDMQAKLDKAVSDAKAESAMERDALHERLVRAEVRAIAAGRLADPADAIKFLDTAKFTDAKGEIDETAIGKAIDELLTGKPYLATGYMPPNGNGNGHGSADQGARGGSRPPATTADAFNAIIRGDPAKRH